MMADARTELQPSLLALPALHPLLCSHSCQPRACSRICFCCSADNWNPGSSIACCAMSHAVRRRLYRPSLGQASPIQRSAAKTRILDVDRIRGMYSLGVSPIPEVPGGRTDPARIAINSRRRSSLVIVRILKVRSRKSDIYYVSSNIETRNCARLSLVR